MKTPFQENSDLYLFYLRHAKRCARAEGTGTADEHVYDWAIEMCDRTWKGLTWAEREHGEKRFALDDVAELKEVVAHLVGEWVHDSKDDDWINDLLDPSLCGCDLCKLAKEIYEEQS